MAASEWALRKALVAIGQADVGAGGLVSLTGKAAPIRRRGDRSDVSRPKVHYSFVLVDYAEGTTDTLAGVVARFDVELDAGAGDLEERLLARLEALMTWSSFDAQGLDVAPTVVSRLDVSDLDLSGGVRRVLDVELKLNR